jgi:hypothetical protein
MPRPIIPGDKRALNKRIVEALANEVYAMELENEPGLGVVFQGQGVAHLVEQSLGCWLCLHGQFLPIDRFRCLLYTLATKGPSNRP